MNKVVAKKIDLIKLAEYLKTHKPVEASRYFGVTKSAISQRMKALGIAVVRSVVMESAGEVVKKELNAVEQLQKINEDANEILDLLMRWNRGEEEALQILESQVKKVRIGINKDGEEEFVKEYKIKDPRELALKAMAEIRGQINLQLEIFQALYDMKAVEEFQKEVLEAIGSVDIEVRNAIITELQKKRAIRAAISFD